MPSVFKPLASLTVWILFLFGVFSLLGGLARVIGIVGERELPLISAYFGFAVSSLTLSVVVAKLRQTME